MMKFSPETRTVHIDAKRPFLEIRDGAEVQRWEYDVVSLRLTFEKFERKHGIITDDRIAPPTEAMLEDIAAHLRELGLNGCSSDTAFRMYRLVVAQFLDVVDELSDVCREILRTEPGDAAT